jgi:hypothetical protein
VPGTAFRHGGAGRFRLAGDRQRDEHFNRP